MKPCGASGIRRFSEIGSPKKLRRKGLSKFTRPGVRPRGELPNDLILASAD
jgi:hypothetical protein